MKVGRGFLSPSWATAGETQPLKPCAGFSTEVTLRAKEIKFRANGLGVGESPPKTSRPACCVGPQLGCGPELVRWGWGGLL